MHFPAITGLMRVFSRRGGERAASADPPALPERNDVVAVFDLEGTVVDSNIVLQYLWVKQADAGAVQALAETAALLAALPAYLAAERRDRGEFVRTFLRRYAGMSSARLAASVRGGYTDTLLAHTSAAALERVREHRAAGHRTVLLTGSIGTLASPVAALFDEVVASEMHEADGVLTGYLARPPLVDEARAAWLTRFAEREGIDLDEVVRLRRQRRGPALARPRRHRDRGEPRRAARPGGAAAALADPRLAARRRHARRPRPGVSRADDVTARLRAAGSVFAEDEAALLLAEASSAEALEELVERRIGGEPLETILGWAEFCGLRVRTAPRVFVPRRRTELLARRAAALLPEGGVAVDLCCGTGAVAMAIASLASPGCPARRGPGSGRGRLRPAQPRAARRQS